MTGRRLALVVANEEYDHEGLSRLRSPTADATALADVLGDSTIADFQVTVVHNEPAYVVAARIEDLFTDSKPDDLLLLHFSCHGLKDEAGALFFAARNTRPDRLGSTAVAADFVQRCMRGSRARQMVLFLDCCYGGAFAQGVAVRASGSANVLEAFPARPLGGGRGRAVISASSAMQYAFEGAELAEDQQQPSVFTAALVQGLRTGEADRDEDGRISLSELYDYLFDKVQEQNPNQTPTRDFELQGELYLAHSRRKKVAAAALPRELADALHDQSMFARMGAVGELRSRLASSDLAIALGAHAALTEVARNDIRYVADAASEALAGATVTPSEEALDFGVVSAGDDVAVRRVELSGPVIARSCSATGSEEWIQVSGATDGFDISVRPTVVGWHSGAVTFEGPAGRVVVPVRVEVQAPRATGAAVVEAVPDVSVAEQVATKPVDTEPVDTEPVDTEPVDTEPVDTEPVGEATAVPEPAVTEAPSTESAVGAAVATPATDPPASARSQPDGTVPPGRTAFAGKEAAPAPSPTGPGAPGADEVGQRGEAPLADRRPQSAQPVRGRRTGWLATAGGLLALVSLTLPFRYDTGILQVPLAVAGHFGKYLALLGVITVVSGVSAAVSSGLRTPALGAVIGAACAASWGVVFMVGVLDQGNDGYQAGYLAALVALSLMITAGVRAAVVVTSEGAGGRWRPGGDAVAWAMVLAGVVGACMIGVQGAYLVAQFGLFGLLGLWAALLAIAVPLAALSLRPSAAAAGLAVGWAIGGLGVTGAYLGLLPDSGDADQTRLAGFGATLLAVGALAAVRAVPSGPAAAGDAGRPGVFDSRAPLSAGAQHVRSTGLTRVAAGAGLLGGLLLLISLVFPFRYDGSVWVEAADLGLVLPLTGVAALAAAVLALAVPAAASYGAGVLLPSAAAGTWLLSTYVGRALDNDMQGYELSWKLGLAAALVLITAAVCTAVDLMQSQPPVLRRPAGRQRHTVLMLTASLVGAACLVVQAAMIAANGGTTWFVLETLWVAVLAVGLPLAGVCTSEARHSLGVILGWVAVGAGIAFHYVQVLNNEDETTGWANAFALSLLVMAGTVLAARGRFAAGTDR